MENQKSNLKMDRPLLAILFIAALFRFLFLSLRPPHFDEGISGWWVDQLIANGFYPYDPTNYHGPFSYYLLFVFKFLMGRTVWALRTPVALMGVGSVYLITQFRDLFGKPLAYSAALAFALSPGLIFFSRYTPHEGGLVFFSILAILGFLRFVDIRDKKSLWQMGIGLAGAACTKETFFIHGVCFGLALICLRIYDTVWKIPQTSVYAEQKFTQKEAAQVVLASLFMIVLFYSGFLLNLNGVIKFLESFAAWLHTGTKGSGHDKPFWYWASLFWRYEWLAALGALACLKVLIPFWSKKDRKAFWLRLFAIYGLGIFVAYSIVPYKTPWCIIEIIWPFYFLLAHFVVSFAQHGRKPRALAYGFFSVALLASALKSIDLNFFNYTTDTEAYVYVQTYEPFMNIDAMVQDLVREDANNYHMPVKIFLVDIWPIPWMWGELTHVGYFGGQVLEDVDAELVLADLSKREYMQSHFKKKYFYKIFQLRGSQPESIAYFDVEKFKKYFPSGSPTFQPVTAPPPSAPGVEK